MTPWVERPTLDIDLAQPIRERFAHLPLEVLAAPASLLRDLLVDVPTRTRWLAYWLRLRTLDRYQAEMKLLARLAQLDWREVAIANLAYDLVMHQYGCSTVVLPTPDGPVVARNMDWGPEGPLARASYLLRYVHGPDLRFAVAGWPGASGVVTGLSARGFAIILHAVPSPERPRRSGYPVLLFIRSVLEDAPDFQAALALLSKQRLTVSALLTLVGSDNTQRVVIERSPTRHAHCWAKPTEPLVVTNHYQRLKFGSEAGALEGLSETTCVRYDTLSALVARRGTRAAAPDTELLFWLSDKHVKQDITAQHIILRPRQREMRLFVPRKLVETSS